MRYQTELCQVSKNGMLKQWSDIGAVHSIHPIDRRIQLLPFAPFKDMTDASGMFTAPRFARHLFAGAKQISVGSTQSLESESRCHGEVNQSKLERACGGC